MIDVISRASIEEVCNNQVIGLGTGSTASCAIKMLGEKVKKEGLNLFAIASSYQSARLAESFGIKVLPLSSSVEADISIDGADEVDPLLNITKGGGGALLNEKILARRSKKWIIVVTEEKMVSKLGERHHLPIEIIPEARSYVEAKVMELGAKSVTLRISKKINAPILTEHNNLLLDAIFEDIPYSLENQLNTITGVVENGLFIGLKPKVIVAKNEKLCVYEYKNGSVVCS